MHKMSRATLILKPASLGLIVLSLSACIPGGASQAPANPSAPRLEADPQVLLVDPKPAAWEAQPVSNAATIVSGGVYIVQPGDTLRGIGNRTGAGSEAIAKANALEPPYVIRPGQKLTIPGGQFHLVGEAQTGIGIARAYGVSWADIVALNGLEEPYILRVGQRLMLPPLASGGMAATPSAPISGSRPRTLEERAAAFNIGIDDIVTGGQPALAMGAQPAAPVATARAASSAPIRAVAAPASFNGRFLWPLNGRITGRFGPQGGGRINDGIDIAVPIGTPIMAAGDGVVAYAGNEIKLFGGLILINHGGGWVSAYGNASRIDVASGQSVKAGQAIGASGQSGHADEPQLHFELRRDRKPVDPLGYLPVR